MINEAQMAAYSEFFPSPEIWFKFVKTCQIVDEDGRLIKFEPAQTRYFSAE